MSKKQIIILSAVIAILILGGTVYMSYNFWPKFGGKVSQKACTMEAKLCPDGSAVGRSGENCEFAACPVAEVGETAGWQAYRNEEYGFEIKYPSDLKIKEEKNIVYFYSTTNPYAHLDVGSEIKIVFIDKMQTADKDYYSSLNVENTQINGVNFSYYPKTAFEYSSYIPSGKNIAIMFSQDFNNKSQILSTFKFTK